MAHLDGSFAINLRVERILLSSTASMLRRDNRLAEIVLIVRMLPRQEGGRNKEEKGSVENLGIETSDIRIVGGNRRPSSA
jgi:hypothetical protein